MAEVHRAGGPLGLVLLPRCTLSEPGTLGSVLGLSEPTYEGQCLAQGLAWEVGARATSSLCVPCSKED